MPEQACKLTMKAISLYVNKLYNIIPVYWKIDYMLTSFKLNN